MKLTIAEVEKVIYDRALDLSEVPFTMDLNGYLSMSPLKDGDLFRQNSPFLILEPVFNGTHRVGPTQVAPTRHYCTLRITYLTKTPDFFTDKKLLESVGNWFAEQTIEQVRFRTFTPYPISKANGFTAYDGVVHFDFELYRGG